MKKKEAAILLSQEKIGPGIYDMWIETSLAKEAEPGQFLCVYPRDGSTLLPRPISICQVAETPKAAGGNTEAGSAGIGMRGRGGRGALRLVYRVAGKGTAEFSGYREGDPVEVMGPLGNGFPLEAGRGRKVFLMGGGIGIPPILELAGRLEAHKQIIIGYRDSNLFLAEDLEKQGELYVATEDGSVGTKGNVMDAIAANGLDAEVIYACGPMPMLRAIKRYAESKGIPAYISLEEHMACGVGACLGCVVKTVEKDAHSHVNNARICTEGPVFEARDVEI